VRWRGQSWPRGLSTRLLVYRERTVRLLVILIIPFQLRVELCSAWNGIGLTQVEREKGSDGECVRRELAIVSMRVIVLSVVLRADQWLLADRRAFCMVRLVTSPPSSSIGRLVP